MADDPSKILEEIQKLDRESVENGGAVDNQSKKRRKKLLEMFSVASRNSALNDTEDGGEGLPEASRGAAIPPPGHTPSAPLPVPNVPPPGALGAGQGPAQMMPGPMMMGSGPGPQGMMPGAGMMPGMWPGGMMTPGGFMVPGVGGPMQMHPGHGIPPPPPRRGVPGMPPSNLMSGVVAGGTFRGMHVPPPPPPARPAAGSSTTMSSATTVMPPAATAALQLPPPPPSRALGLVQPVAGAASASFTGSAPPGPLQGPSRDNASGASISAAPQKLASQPISAAMASLIPTSMRVRRKVQPRPGHTKRRAPKAVRGGTLSGAPTSAGHAISRPAIVVRSVHAASKAAPPAAAVGGVEDDYDRFMKEMNELGAT